MIHKKLEELAKAVKKRKTDFSIYQHNKIVQLIDNLDELITMENEEVKL